MQAFDLPPITEQLIELIGYKETLVLVEYHAGRRLRVPYHAERAVVLNNILKPESVQALCDEMGGVVIDDVPKQLIIEHRDQTIREERQRLSLTDLSRKYNLSRRWIRRICNERGDDGMNNCHRPSNQYHLF